MADYTITRLEDVDDVLGDYPGEMRMMTSALGAEQVAFTHRRMPQHTGGKGSYGHRHKEQEEIYFVVSGTLQFKLDDDVVDVGAGMRIYAGSYVSFRVDLRDLMLITTGDVQNELWIALAVCLGFD